MTQGKEMEATGYTDKISSDLVLVGGTTENLKGSLRRLAWMEYRL